ncbi:MAG: single-stranded-DNA-specific exonuclease RecJ [Phycisphaerales bacterium]|nr:MAG: single-stranded-DNA-specific exonuclease RecJ [Phycisphaerales bacterium]
MPDTAPPVAASDAPHASTTAVRQLGAQGSQEPHETLGLTRRWRARCEAGLSERSHRLLDRVLAARGLGVASEADAFLEPTLRDLHDPGLLPGLERAAERLLAALDAGEPIVIYGDYDVDGITASAILYHTLTALARDRAAQVRTYVPHRIDEGYGLNAEALGQLAREGARVVVSVDCGVTAVAEAAAAREQGLDLIITDHHNPPPPGSPWPDAFSVVHPRAPGSVYPFAELCGAGVAYKLAWRLCTMRTGERRVSPELRALLLDALALAALGTIADIVPLVGENRVIARHGLRRVRSTRLIGLNALIEASSLASDKINEEDVGFRLAPRLNAAGRLGHADEAVELLTTASAARAHEIAARLSHQNDERRRVERSIAERASELASDAGMTGTDRRAIVLADASWHPGVVGIVCSRLVERFSRPTILLQRREDGLASGSARSVPGLSVHEALCECADLLETFGGHDMAAGLKLRLDRLDAFTERFTEACNRRLTPERLVPSLTYDCVARVEELSPGEVGDLARLAPFGRENPPVRLRLAPARLIAPAKTFGQRGDHLDLRLGTSDRAVRVVGWRWAEKLASLPRSGLVEAVVEPKLSTWTGRPAVEPVLVDLRLCEG